mmetsp:Transcript_32187/g.31509  ORF Transcript_32187/g.31509 Transcript_32187/m.31509 type:complete len:145 (+) Transcript_32187:1629-2063(+)|eukprot:CAMPEP_0170544738 /NCGR_PEP_ID=MMETSP0211-20121228/3383_1 /TAXON_ID=311385 /ORGANISM="Pseudokeronopsis sp., Strain OXSARD2" /LENGTH=144 /DNA_ID=CAMNT_0010848457 /DNA_START=2357 /DNA_END=2791 /DNA_ORIENTATION=-
MKYKAELRHKFLSFMKEKARIEKEVRLLDNCESIIQKRIQRMREDAEYKMVLIQEFKETLDAIEWSEKLKDEEKIERNKLHLEFISKITADKAYQKEMYALERILVHEERISNQKKDLDFEQLKLIKEQEEILRNIDYLNKCNL